jgi:hypothetical protein
MIGEGYAIVLVFVLCLIYGKVSGARDQLKRIADFCERSEERIKASNPPPSQSGRTV